MNVLVLFCCAGGLDWIFCCVVIAIAEIWLE